MKTLGSSVNPLRTILVPAALSQRMNFEATMYMASTHLDVLRGTESSETTLIHRGKSLKLINEHLHRHGTSPSDLLIAAVFSLANFDASLPNPISMSQNRGLRLYYGN